MDDHWRVEPGIDKFTQIQVGENNTRIAMLRNGKADLAALDFKIVPGVVQEGYRFLETMPGGFVGQSILFPGLLWEHSHARTGEPLEPWACKDRSSAAFDNACGSGPNEGPYTQDYPWIGNPWGTQDAPCANGDGPGHERCGNAPYSDTDNPPGISDMEQARLSDSPSLLQWTGTRSTASSSTAKGRPSTPSTWDPSTPVGMLTATLAAGTGSETA